jgi:hypothetical protein
MQLAPFHALPRPSLGGPRIGTHGQRIATDYGARRTPRLRPELPVTGHIITGSRG